MARADDSEGPEVDEPAGDEPAEPAEPARSYVYVWKVQGSYADLCKLLGTDLCEDIQKLRNLLNHLTKKVRLHSEASQEALVNIVNENLQKLEQQLTTYQRKYQQICCEIMNFKGQSGRPSFGQGAFFMLTKEAADEIKDVFPAGRKVYKGYVVVSPEYEELLIELLRGARRPVTISESYPLPALKVERKKRQLLYHLKSCKDAVRVKNGFIDNTETSSLSSRQTHSTGSHPRNNGMSFGVLRKKFKNRKLPVKRSLSEHEQAQDEEEQRRRQQEEEDDSEEEEGREEEREEHEAGTEGAGTSLTSLTSIDMDLHEDSGDYGKKLPLVPDLLQVCKTSSDFQERLLTLLQELQKHAEDGGLLDHPNLAESVASEDQEAGLRRLLLRAKGCLSEEALRAYFAQPSRKESSSSSISRSTRGFQRGLNESAELVAKRVALDADERMEAEEPRLQSEAKEINVDEVGLFEAADKLLQMVNQMLCRVLSHLEADLPSIASNAWNKQNQARKEAAKRATSSLSSIPEGGRGKRSFSHSTFTTREEFGKSPSLLVDKESARRENSYKEDRKGGRRHSITGADRTGNNRQRDYVVPF